MNNYLNKEILNDIETKIMNLHNQFREKFNLNETSLRNIKIGDNLSSKTLFLNFPYESNESINNNIGEYTSFIDVNSEKFICHKVNNNNDGRYIGYKYRGHYNYFYYKYDNSINNTYNYIRYKLPEDFGIISLIDNTNQFYQYIKIIDDETKPLKYIKKTWIDNEIPYLQYIDHIEEGINNIAQLFYKPSGYETKKWTTTGYYNIETSDYGLAQKPISQKDFDRWTKNIELLESAFDSFFSVWNVVSYINWNKYCDLDWSDYSG